MTGVDRLPRISLTASIPELPSASWMSARLGRLACSKRSPPRPPRACALRPQCCVRAPRRFLLNQRNQRFVFNNKDVGRDLVGDFTIGGFDQCSRDGFGNVKYAADFGEAEPFQPVQKEGRARQSGYGVDVTPRRDLIPFSLFGRVLRMGVDRSGSPNLEKQTIKSDLSGSRWR